MRAVRQYERYPKLCRAFESTEELGEAINRSRWYVSRCLNGHSEFTHREKMAALRYLGEPAERKRDFFPEEVGA